MLLLHFMLTICKHKCATATEAEIATQAAPATTLTAIAAAQVKKHSANNSSSYVTPEMAKDMLAS